MECIWHFEKQHKPHFVVRLEKAVTIGATQLGARRARGNRALFVVWVQKIIMIFAVDVGGERVFVPVPRTSHVPHNVQWSYLVG